MADVTLAQEIAASSLPWYEEEVNELCLAREDPVMERLSKKIKVYDGGTKIQYPISVQPVSNGFRWYSNDEVFAMVGGQHLRSIEAGWARFQDNTTLANARIDENSGKGQIGDVLKAARDNLSTNLNIKVARRAHNLDAGLMSTFDDIFATAAGTAYMGLLPGDVTGKHPTASAATSLFAAQTDTVTEALDYETFDNAVEDQSEGYAKWRAKLGFTTRWVLSAFRSQFQPQERYKDKDALKAGWTGQIVVSGVPIFSTNYAKGTDRKTADNYLTLITDQVFLVKLKKKMVSVTQHDLRPFQDAVAYQALGNCQMVCLDPFHQYRFEKLKPSTFNA